MEAGDREGDAEGGGTGRVSTGCRWVMRVGRERIEDTKNVRERGKGMRVRGV